MHELEEGIEICSDHLLITIITNYDKFSTV